jgi:bacillithiol biosynthesis deacetylase BshB1
MADLLVFAPHPDDAEIHCGATMARHARLGARVVVVDATRGEMASRGTPALRAEEAAAAAQALGLAGRENLGLRDGHLGADDLAAREAIVDALRRHRPSVVLGIHPHARHPDHIALAALLRGALKAAALHGLRTPSGAAAHTGMRLWSYEAELRIAPDLLVPAEAGDWRRKLDSIRCYASQLHQPGTAAPATTIAAEGFLDEIDLRGRYWGRQCGAAYAEAFAAGPDLPRVGDLRLI